MNTNIFSCCCFSRYLLAAYEPVIKYLFCLPSNIFLYCLYISLEFDFLYLSYSIILLVI